MNVKEFIEFINAKVRLEFRDFKKVESKIIIHKNDKFEVLDCRFIINNEVDKKNIDDSLEILRNNKLLHCFVSQVDEQVLIDFFDGKERFLVKGDISEERLSDWMAISIRKRNND